MKPSQRKGEGFIMYIDRWKVQGKMAEARISSFAELARRMDVPRQYVHQWLSGRGFTSVTLESLVCALDCTPNDILTWQCKERGN